MRTLVSIKKDLEFDKGLLSLLEVLKNISVAQYRILEQKLKTYEKFSEALKTFFEFIDIKGIDHPFLNPREKKQIVIAITSDSGLLGGLNRHVVTAALNELAEVPGKLIVIGERGKLYARESGIPFVAFGGIREEERYEQSVQLRDYVVSKIIKESIGYLKVVYPRPVSFTVQRVETVQFLPYSAGDAGAADAKWALSDIIMESNVGDMLEYILFLWIGHKMYEVFGLSRLAEFAARFVHLEESAQKLKDMDEKLQQQYFRVRHELIDRNMRELFSARLLYVSTH
ncbi:MAG: FoF1 ATP synthase subunit gamma [Candidatus Omnitrophota bacterium]